MTPMESFDMLWAYALLKSVIRVSGFDGREWTYGRLFCPPNQRDLVQIEWEKKDLHDGDCATYVRKDNFKEAWKKRIFVVSPIEVMTTTFSFEQLPYFQLR